MQNHANHIAAMPGVLLIDDNDRQCKPGFFTEFELLKKCREGKATRNVRMKTKTIRIVDKIMDGLVTQGT